MKVAIRSAVASLAVIVLSGCAGLGGLEQVLQAPTFAVEGAQQAQLRLLGPSADRPTGGASIRLYARVRNPNPIGLTLTRVVGNLALGGTRAAQVNFPLGVPMQANGESVIPLDVVLSFSDLPGLANVAQSALTGQPVRYSLNGTVGVDAGLLGQPSFGPTQLLEGNLRVTR
ncbi:LEA type 2 family protein [Longimicrobium terrae]|uniref:Late embryogenesis abundant protein LEA-2 subgroup domain-containing protein n=1 Tax=Longimicrobium terrae TaxID=1639882 RepID=A0A841H149_9BACT|nr:LEA type 2 family protein [Longimicrobium terrae]MBB4637427.1 hypothetical protein [Longimicrobium terrae]MBB6071825.1 hypothetical protein [Longimicrobium terrae]NNC30374.1 LEA type 2 family protein [Longimicrobium terrae]